jgi:hypothetical protein
MTEKRENGRNGGGKEEDYFHVRVPPEFKRKERERETERSKYTLFFSVAVVLHFFTSFLEYSAFSPELSAGNIH